MEQRIHRILLVEDSPTDTLMLQEALLYSRQGQFRLTAAETLSSGLQQLRRNPFDVILLDLGLPDSLGLETFTQAQAVAGDTPIVVLSGNLDESLALQAVQHGAQDYLVKDQDIWNLVGRSVRYAIERAQTQAALRASEKRFRALIENSADAVALVGQDGTILYESPSAVNLLGYAMDDLVGHSLFEFSHPDESDLNRTVFEQILKNPSKAEMGEVRYRRKDGSFRWLEVTSNNLLDEPDIRAVVMNYRDVTDRHEDEEALRRSEYRYRLLAENMDDVIWVLSAETMRFVYVSPSVERLRGFTAEEVMAQTLDQTMTRPYLEQIAAGVPARVADFLAGDPSAVTQRHDVEQICKDGSTVMTEVVTTLLRSSTGELEFLGVSRNISQRRQAERALAESEARLRSYIESAPVAMFVVDPQGVLMEANPATQKLVGHPAEALLGRNIIDLALPEDRAAAARDLADVLQNISSGGDYRMLRADGQILHVGVRAVALTGGRLLGYCRDMTEQKNSELLLRTRLRMAELGQRSSMDKLLQIALDCAETLTNSQVSFFHFVDSDQQAVSLQYWSERTRATGCNVPEGQMHYAIAQAGVWTDCFHSRAPVIHDRYADLPHRKGLPDGHVPMQSDLCVPILQNNSVIAILGVGNKAAAYTEKDVAILQELAAITNDLVARKRAEDALRDSEERFRKVFYTSPDAVSIVSLDTGTYQSVNGHFLQLGGYTEAEVIGHSGLEVGAWKDDQQRLRWMKALQEHGEVINMEACFRVNHGRELDGLISSTIIDLGGKPFILSITRDIRERKQIEEKLRESELHYRSVVNNVPLVMFVVNPDGIFTLSEGNGLASLGLEPGQVVGQSAFTLYADYPDVIAALRRALAGEGFVEKHTVQGIIFETHYSPLIDENGKGIGVIGISTDITEREMAMLGLRKRTEELQRLLEAGRKLGSTLDLKRIFATLYQILEQSVPCDGILISTYNPETRMIRMAYGSDRGNEIDASGVPEVPLNPDGLGTQSRVIRSGKSMLMNDFPSAMKTSRKGYVTDQKGVRPYQPGDEEAPGSAILVPLMINDAVIGVLQVYYYRLNAYTEDHLRFIEALVYRVTSAMANATLFEQVQTELEERRRAEEEVRKLNAELEQRVADRTADLSRANAELERTARAKDEFLASMSHELRTPLNAILTLTESLEEGIYGSLAERQVKSLRTISESGHHLLNLINDVLDLSKIEAGKLVLQLATVEVEAVCQSSLRLVRQQAQKKRLHVELSLDPALTQVTADGRYLKQMLVNLLSNAVKFTPEDGHIGLEVRGDAAGGAAKFTVWDTGIGIDPQQAHRLFRPFMQIDSGLSRQYGGTGLGLSLVYRMAELHGGSVSLTSVQSEGSRFTISLPWEGPAQRPVTGPLAVDRIPELRLALLVEDSASASEQMERYLNEMGAQVTALGSGAQAVERAAALRPDVILLDILLPDLSGWEILPALKSDPRTCHIPVILVTVVDEAARGLALGASAYLVKPITRGRLHEALQKAFPAGGAVTAESDCAKPQAGTLEAKPLVLIAEDNPTNQATYYDYLSAHGYRVLLAGNGKEALARAREAHPDLILMDIQMPGMDGLEATRRLRADEKLRDTAIIALTALAMPGDRELCLEAGADHYLTKPVSLKHLAQTIEDHLQRRQP